MNLLHASATTEPWPIPSCVTGFSTFDEHSSGGFCVCVPSFYCGAPSLAMLASPLTLLGSMLGTDKREVLDPDKFLNPCGLGCVSNAKCVWAALKATSNLPLHGSPFLPSLCRSRSFSSSPSPSPTPSPHKPPAKAKGGEPALPAGKG